MNNPRDDAKQFARVRDIFDERALSGRANGMERGHGPVARRGFELLKIAPGQRFLDIGCGNGYSVRWAARAARSVAALGIDVSSQMITLARELTDRLPNARFRRLHFPSPALPPESFHAIFSVDVFYYLPDVRAALRAVHALLKPGGRFACVVDYYRENRASHAWPLAMNVDMQLLSVSEWRQAFVEAGLEVLGQERLRAPLQPGTEPSWRHTEGSLLTLGLRRCCEDNCGSERPHRVLRCAQGAR